MPQEQKHIFFEGVNGLRFFAALAVVITHIELMKGFFGIENNWQSTIIFNLGGLGVYFFFVLSGFLITYLLLVEKQRTQTISVKQFYWRRLLRIWPLYYAITLIGFFVLPKFQLFNIESLQHNFELHFNTNLFLYLLILPNVAFSMFSAVPNIGQTWSIGVEEQFYIAWPWIIKKSNHIFKTLMSIIVGLILFKILILGLGYFFKNDYWYSVLKKLVAMSKFECMAIGGIGAHYVFIQHPVLSYLKKSIVSIMSLVLIILLLFITPPILQDGLHIIIALLFLIILLQVVQSKIGWLNHVILDYLGRISYGLYMYHLMLIPFIIFVLTKFINPSNAFMFNGLLYVITIVSSILVASLSYYTFELKFIKLKEKFAVVKSGAIN